VNRNEESEQTQDSANGRGKPGKNRGPYKTLNDRHDINLHRKFQGSVARRTDDVAAIGTVMPHILSITLAKGGPPSSGRSQNGQ